MLTVPLLKKVFPSLLWNFPENEKNIYLTFDDGPIPEVTPFVLNRLKEFNAKATFFCVGKNVKENPEIFQSLLAQGHSTGNHTYHHLKGWQTSNKTYFEDVNECGKLVSSKLFRPPYGKIKPSQIRELKKIYRIVMWNILSKDYDPELSAEECLQRCIQAKSGSVIVFHDSIKAFSKLQIVLPHVLKYFQDRNFAFKAIDQS